MTSHSPASVDWDDLHIRLERAMRGVDPSNLTASKMEVVQSEPAAMPSDEDVARLVADVMSRDNHALALKTARQIKALFGPILAEKEQLEQYRNFVHAVFGYSAPDANTVRMMAAVIDGEIAPPWPLPEVVEKMGLVPASRALAAEAALAAERERCAKVAERFMAAGKIVDGQFVAGPNTPFAIAAAIRAQGE